MLSELIQNDADPCPTLIVRCPIYKLGITTVIFRCLIHEKCLPTVILRCLFHEKGALTVKIDSTVDTFCIPIYELGIPTDVLRRLNS